MITLKKTPVAIAIAAAISANGVSANESMTLIGSGAEGSRLLGDGYAYSGQTARSQSLQMNYFTHDDVGNIWVNPALAAKYSDRVMINVNNNNNDGEGSGGIIYGPGNQTFGVYIGRDSVSNFGDSLDLSDDGRLDLVEPGAPGQFENRDPESQFDLFYSIGLGGINLGARLNYQNNEQNEGEGPDQFARIIGAVDGNDNEVTFTNEFATIDEIIEQRISNIRAGFANDIDRPESAELVFSGGSAVDRERASADLNAQEINLSLGFEMPGLGLDGAVLIGQASGTQTRSQSRVQKNYALFIENGEQRRRQVRERDDQLRDELDIDDGTSFGLSLRYTVFNTQDSTLRLSGSFLTQDYSGEQTSSFREMITLWADDEDNAQLRTTERRRIKAGELVRENDQFTFIATYELRPQENTQISLSTGLIMTDTDRGFSSKVVEDIIILRAQQDGLGLDAGQFQEFFRDTVGMQSRVDVENELFEIPLIIAAEHNFNERWTGRGSISRNLYRDLESTTTTFEYGAIQEPDAIDAPEADEENQSLQSGPERTVQTNRERMGNDETWINQPTQVRLGAGYQRGNFGIDTLIGKEFFTQGNDNTLFAAANFTYNF